MRALFWVLLLGNVILFAVVQRGGLGWGEQAYQVQPALQEDKIRLLDAPSTAQGAPQNAIQNISQYAPQYAPQSAPQSAPQNAPNKALPVADTTVALANTPAKAAVSAAIPAPAAKTVPPVKTASPTKPIPAVKTAPTDVKQNTVSCLEWGDFSGADLKRATEMLSVMQLGAKLSQRQVEYSKGYWVYIPSLKNKAAANRKIFKLKAQGVKEYFIVQDKGALRYSISLGVFKTPEAAQNYLNELRAKGVRSAQIGERATKLKTTMFTLDGVDAATEAKLAAARKDFAGSELKNVPCALTR